MSAVDVIKAAAAVASNIGWALIMQWSKKKRMGGIEGGREGACQSICPLLHTVSAPPSTALQCQALLLEKQLLACGAVSRQSAIAAAAATAATVAAVAAAFVR